MKRIQGSRCPRRPDTILKRKSGKARIATGIVSLQTSYRLDDRDHAGGAKDSDKQEVALHRRQTTTKRSQRGERGQLPHPWVHLQDTFHFALIWRRPGPGPGLITTHAGTGRVMTS